MTITALTERERLDLLAHIAAELSKSYATIEYQRNLPTEQRDQSAIDTVRGHINDIRAPAWKAILAQRKNQ